MAYYIPDRFVRLPPYDHLSTALYVKHVVISDRLVSEPIRYKRVEGSLLLEYLMSRQGPEVIDRLMTVCFRFDSRSVRTRGLWVATSPSQEILMSGIVFSGRMYRFLGHSNTQLKEKTCYLMNASDEEIYDLLSQFGDFSKIKTTAKRAKRIGLLFSTFDRSIALKENEYRVIEDVKRGKYNFTDGCGFMSHEFARDIRDTHHLQYMPSVVQVRYQGFKGVLLLSRQLEAGIKVYFRDSMKKFTVPNEGIRNCCTTLGVVKYSRCYTNGYLNKQITMLLADSGVEHEYLTWLQRNFHDTLNELSTTTERAEYYLSIKGKKALLDRLHARGLQNAGVQRELESLRRQEIKKMKKEDDTDAPDPSPPACKLRVLVPKSRLVFGVCDPFDELEYGQCFFQPTLFNEEQMESFLAAREVMVVRNPCYYPGDIRVLKLMKNKPEYGDLSDCIVFPVRGQRPHADESSGGDLDGDEFFVSWDRNLIPPHQTPPFDYSPNSPLQVISGLIEDRWGQFTASVARRITSWGCNQFPSLFGTSEQAARRDKIKERRHMLEYFTTFNNDLISRVDAIFMKYAASYGPSCNECVYLNR